MRVLALVGSLRQQSINRAFCEAAALLAPPDLRVEVFAGLGALPLFNPDLDDEAGPAVDTFRESVAGSDALLIASPEYAHGISGVMKNALDWLVSDARFVGKPVAVVNTSPRAHHAHDALLEILTTMSAEIVVAASVTVAVMGRFKTRDEMLGDADTCGQVATSMQRLQEALAARPAISSRPSP